VVLVVTIAMHFALIISLQLENKRPLLYIGQSSERRGLIKSDSCTSDEVNKFYLKERLPRHVNHVASNNKFDLNLNE